MKFIKELIRLLVKYTVFNTLLVVFNIVIFPISLIVLLCRKIDKQSRAIDSELTSYLHKKMRK